MNCPVLGIHFTANDANCFALSEAVDGAASDARVVFGVILGTGTGGGIVVEQRLVEGPNRVAGEWGHNPLPWSRDDDEPAAACYCGRRGCIRPTQLGDDGHLDSRCTIVTRSEYRLPIPQLTTCKSDNFSALSVIHSSH